MNNNNSSRGIQTIRDTRENKLVQTDKFANISKVKPLNFFHHLHKSINKKNQLPSYFIFFPTSVKKCPYSKHINIWQYYKLATTIF